MFGLAVVEFLIKDEFTTEYSLFGLQTYLGSVFRFDQAFLRK